METAQRKEEEGEREGAESFRGCRGNELARGSLNTIWGPVGRIVQSSKRERPRKRQESLEAYHGGFFISGNA